MSKEPSKKSFEGAYYFVRSVHPDLPAEVIEKVAMKIAKQMDKINAPRPRKLAAALSRCWPKHISER